jgi:mannose PTS system EIIA component
VIGIIVAAHGGLAEALLETARLVVPQGAEARAVGISRQDDSTRYEAKLRAALAEVQSSEGVLMLTDMFGGSPSNISMTLHAPGKVEVLTGANLPMLIRALQLSARGVDLATAARECKEYGRRAITVATEVLAGGPKPFDKEKTSP